MGFYGNITNINKSTFQFDKRYSNRYEMDQSAATDGVFIGRYVLVDYDEGASLEALQKLILNGSSDIDLNELANISSVSIVPGYKRMDWNDDTQSFVDSAPLRIYSGLPTYDWVNKKVLDTDLDYTLSVIKSLPKNQQEKIIAFVKGITAMNK